MPVLSLLNLSRTNVAKHRHRRLLFVLRCLAHSRHILVVGNKVTCRWTYATNVAGLMQSYFFERFKIFALVHVQSFMERWT